LGLKEIFQLAQKVSGVGCREREFEGSVLARISGEFTVQPAMSPSVVSSPLDVLGSEPAEGSRVEVTF
jgi:hypothetical protein